ncbi:MAG: REP element-mobilizing transposase RayT, partial [Cognaticolwellia sp.]
MGRRQGIVVIVSICHWYMRLCAYAVMSNHVHLVLCVDKDKAVSWSDKQVVGRWHRLHRGTLLSQKFMRNALLSESEWISLKETIAIYRQRLYD